MERSQMSQLTEIQLELNAPKNQYNKHGNFNYRSAEDIMEALKPLLKQHKCTLYLSDATINVGTHNYIQATAILTNNKGEQVIATGMAREAEVQKGMHDAQLTGSTSSYARKYCLSGLFLIDDNADPDSGSYDKPEKRYQAGEKETHESVIENELGGRNLTEEAGNCTNLAELAVWYGSLPDEMKKKGSPAVAVKDNRKEEIQLEQQEAGSPAQQTEQIDKPKHTFESLKTLTLAKLKDIAKKLKVVGYSKMNKVTLITSIIKTVGE